MWINVNGIKMYYEKHGSGRPLIMVHGNSEDHTIFYDSMVLLRNHFTVYTVDSRGHGFSERVEEFHYDDMADDMSMEQMLEGYPYKRYTKAELNAMLDRAEANFEAGRGIPDEEAWDDLEEELALQEDEQLEIAKTV